MSKWTADEGNGLFLLSKAEVQNNALEWLLNEKLGWKAKWCRNPTESIMDNQSTKIYAHDQ